MIQITKAEAATVRERYPHACIAKTCHKRYLEESDRYLVLIPDNEEAAAILKAKQKAKERRNKYKNNNNVKGFKKRGK